jgi:hypothetical protein
MASKRLISCRSSRDCGRVACANTSRMIARTTSLNLASIADYVVARIVLIATFGVNIGGNSQ